MAEADLQIVTRWLSTNPGPALSQELVPGASSAERGVLATLGRVAGTLLREFKPGIRNPQYLLNLCGGSNAVASWFSGRGCPEPDPAIVQTARRLLIDDGEDGLATLYARLVSPTRRRRLGTFFTPQLEVDRMTSNWSERHVRPRSIVDVGAGVGIYTVAGARQWPNSQVYAVDVNPVTLGLLVLRVASLDEDLAVNVVLADFADWITESWLTLPPPRLILGNPPYTRMQLLPKFARRELALKAGGLVGRRASLAGLLTAISLRLLGPQDGLCLLLPAQWLESDYADGMRNWLWAATHRRIELRLFSSSLFEDAQVDAVSLSVGPVSSQAEPLTLLIDGDGSDTRIMRDGNSPAQWRALFSDRKPMPRAPTPVAQNSVASFSTPTLVDHKEKADGGTSIRSVAGRAFIGAAEPLPKAQRLGDVATVHRGVATGCNRFFVLSESERLDWNLPTSVLRPVCRRLRTLSGLRGHGWTHFPQRGSEPSARSADTVGELAWLLVTGPNPESDEVIAYLERGLRLEADSSFLSTQRANWYDLSPLIKTVDVAISPMTKQTFRVMPTPSGTCILNNLYGIRWRDHVDSHSQAQVLQYLTSDLGQYRIRGLARSQASGLMKIEPRALAGLQLSSTSELAAIQLAAEPKSLVNH